MASKNVETITRAHKFFNSRKLQECANEFADGGSYRDLPRGKDFSKGEFIGFMQGWIQAFPDCQVADARYLDAGDTVIVEFKARGINNGPLGSFPPTGKKIDLPYCEVVRFDKQGKIDQVTAYYDLLSMLSQLGHLQPPREVQPGATP
jgi:steroid delta-isomerase-like uncharacterized protein